MVDMIGKQERLSLFWTNAKIIVIICMISVCFQFCNTEKKHMGEKIIGYWSLDYDNSYWERLDSDIYISLNNLLFTMDSVKLPYFSRFSDSVYYNDFEISKEEYDYGEDTLQIIVSFLRYKREKACKGGWRIINISPDSILLDAPAHPLNGKYKVTFFIDKYGLPEAYPLDCTHKMLLENDSTRLICVKCSNNSNFSKIDMSKWIN